MAEIALDFYGPLKLAVLYKSSSPPVLADEAPHESFKLLTDSRKSAMLSSSSDD